MPARGSWNIDAAIKARWDARSLESQFKQVWPDPTVTHLLALCDSSPRPDEQHPKPYCIYEKGEPIVRGHMSGATRDTELQLQDVPVQFAIYGHTKEQAKDFAQLVAGAFDKAALNLQDDQLVSVKRGPDFDTKQDEETWVWVIQYTIQLLGTYPAAYS